MWLFLLAAYAAGALTSVGMLAAQLGGTRLLVLRPKATYSLFLALWPVFWLIGLGSMLVVLWALAGSALLNRGGLR